MRPRKLFPLLLLLLAGHGGDALGATTRPEISEAARSYLDAALDVMQTHSVHRARIAWPELRARAHQAAGAAQTPAETYPAIAAAVRDLGDRHSSFRGPRSSTGDTQPAPQPPTGRSLEGGIAYLNMPSFSHRAATEHADAYHAVVRDLDAASPCGWVVDLRQNGGGNMWPMLAGIGPVLGEGEVGRFIYPDGAVWHWWYRYGHARMVSPVGSTATVAKVSGTPYQLKRPMPPVAVLTGPRTASSGEAMVTAFRGRPSTRSFGAGTAGVSTGNRAFPLSDGAVINLTVTTFADRTGRLYGESIVPDEVIPAGDVTRDPATDRTLRAAVEWLREQPPCGG